eukprot:TRINITY_DN10685_c0_g1_i3.p1 TRINITY_DN10685_c0_g1~~TRINITY_DN10685_c0_g1_i3.p1  ORF type:complete len:477 (-),score=83.46 TRINITY_DN10685_c0_g1_i3:60-1490(-)
MITQKSVWGAGSPVEQASHIGTGASRSVTNITAQSLRGKVTNENDLYIWGEGGCGQLGHGADKSNIAVPKIVDAMLGRNVMGIACRGSHTAGWTDDGELFTWGDGSNGRLGHGDSLTRSLPHPVWALHGKKVVSVALGDYHAIALANTGKVYSWGMGFYGQLGHGDDTDRYSAKMIEALSEVNVVEVACGLLFSAVLTDQGEVYTWGWGEEGQLGHDDTESLKSPKLVEGLRGMKMKHLGCGDFHMAAITEEGHVFTWGDGSFGQLGHGTADQVNAPKQVEALKGKPVCSLACGSGHMAVLGEDGKVWQWGWNDYGQLGTNDAMAQKEPTQIKALLVLVVTQIACGTQHTIALTDNNEIYTWGGGSCGQLGHGVEKNDCRVPRVVSALQGKGVRQVYAGGNVTAVTVAHNWVPDAESTTCMNCKEGFTVVRRRHHCRNCGGIFCGSCSSKRFPILKFGYTDPVRVCDACYQILSGS